MTYGMKGLGLATLLSLSLPITADDPDEAAAWANELIGRINTEMRERAIASTKASVGYLEAELDRTANVETRLAISRLMETQINQRMLASVTAEYAFRVVDPALPPDPRDVFWPRKSVFAGLGVVFGLLLGGVAALVTGRERSSRE